MSQSTTFTMTKPQWYSTPWNKVEYELIETNLNRTFTLSVTNTYTRSTTLKHKQQDPQINLMESITQHLTKIMDVGRVSFHVMINLLNLTLVLTILLFLGCWWVMILAKMTFTKHLQKCIKWITKNLKN